MLDDSASSIEEKDDCFNKQFIFTMNTQFSNIEVQETRYWLPKYPYNEESSNLPKLNTMT